MRLRFQGLAAVFLSVVALSSTAFAADLPEYQPGVLPEGSLTSVGSDSMGGLVNLWVESYKQAQPRVEVQVVSRGSATAPPALIEGSADLGPMARPFKSNERAEFIAAYGFEPTQIRSALAAVAIYAPVSNPLQSITIQQLEKVFSGGATAEPQTWSSVSVEGKLASEPIMVFGQSTNQYLTGYFKQRVLLQKNFTDSLMTTSTYKALFTALSMNKNGIGYGNVRDDMGDAVKMIAVQADASSKAYLPTLENITSGQYPLSRSLNIYVVREPGKSIDPALQDFLRFVLSKQGQEVVVRQGLIPLPASIVAEELAKLQ